MIANRDNDKPLARLLVVDDDPDNAQSLKTRSYSVMDFW